MTFPTPWQYTPLTSGSPGSNTFPYAITGLSASTVYEYQAYMVVDGNPYYGDMLTGTTANISFNSPTVKTGIATSILSTGFTVSNNCVCTNGGLPIAEYGVLYSQATSSLCYSTSCKVPTYSGITTGTSYNKTISGLAANTMTYFTAFAKNAVGIGCGCICCQQTNSIQYVAKLSHIYPPPSGYDSCGCICLSPAMLPDTEWLDLDFTVAHTVCGNGASTTTVYCKPNGSPSYCPVYKYYFQTLCDISGFACGNDSCTIRIYCGDSLCYENMTTGSISDSCSQLTLHGVSWSGGITACIDHTVYECYNDRVVC
jgi:hypothetical protein